jgi:nucleotide-binding universal stress UspA family protein
MKRILVATDGSEGADRAIDYAAGLAKKVGCELVIVNIIGGYGLPGEVLAQFTEGQHVWLNELLASLSAQTVTRARDRARGLGAGTILLESRSGAVAETIVEIALEKKVDAIIVGKRGASGIERLLLGSVSQKLVSLAAIPVIVVP